MKNFIIIILSTYVIITSCSRKVNTSLSRFYHNLTAHYNAYFNGYEAYKAGIKKINNNPQDNYLNILNVYPFLNENSYKQANADMERTKSKCAIVIKKHSITARPKTKDIKNLSPKQKEFYNRTEFCNWVPKAWLLNGKANFIQHDWYAAEENFEYVIKEYSWDPIKYEASIWLALAYTQLTKYNDALAILDRLEGEKNFPKKLRKDLYIGYANVYIKQKKFSEAINSLNNALVFLKNRQEKARVHFILAQLYQLNNNYFKATEHYTKAIKYSNIYELTFNAQINRANCFDASSANASVLKKQLLKMAKDEKNKEYLDQIYYSLGNISYKENDIQQAIVYYRLSISKSQNNIQKAITYYTLGDLYYKKKNYIYAKQYYDSSLAYLPETDLHYSRVKNYSENLKEVAENLLIVQQEDSLQRIAKMSQSEREKFIDNIIKKIIEEEQKKLQEEQEQIYGLQFIQNKPDNLFSAHQTGSGKWYFYNPATISLGAMEFKRRWGNRKLEDHWRRKNKNIVATTTQNESDTSTFKSEKVTSKNYTPKQREYYLKDLPLNDSLMALSNKKIEQALIDAAEASINKIKDYDLARELLEDFIKRFSSSNFLLEVYYKLYNVYKSLNNSQQAEKYKNIIITNYPESKYAHILSDPDYLVKLNKERADLLANYSKAYDYYKNSNYIEALKICYDTEKNITHENLNILLKFKLLKALCYGHSRQFQQYKDELTEIINKYKGTEECELAKLLISNLEKYDANYLASLNQFTPNPAKVQDNKISEKLSEQQLQKHEEKYKGIFKDEENDKFYVYILIDKSANLNIIKFNLFEYNIDYFSMFDFQIFNGIFNDKYNYLRVFPFSDKIQSLKYYKHLVKNKDRIFETLNEKLYYIFIISESNLQKLQINKNIDEYITFFQKEILKK
ncbi:MAG: hypothetical protein N3A01_02970 [Bacteroidales bacterium]|nr:hypothetical protein [Bacteroidales bacterium]